MINEIWLQRSADMPRGKLRKTNPAQLPIQSPSCRCGTGFYCCEHKRYGTEITEGKYNKYLTKVGKSRKYKTKGEEQG